MTEFRPAIGFVYPHRSGQLLSETELAAVNRYYGTAFVSGRVVGSSTQRYQLKRRKTSEEINEMEKYGDPVRFSQHSSIVMDQNVQEKAVAYDLAIGNCMAFEDPAFWLNLRKRADWRHEFNPDAKTKNYHKTGILDLEETKQFMNKPDQTLPVGEFGVVNDYGPKTCVEPARHPEVHHKEVPVHQWDMPEPAGYRDVPAKKKAEGTIW